MSLFSETQALAHRRSKRSRRQADYQLIRKTPDEWAAIIGRIVEGQLTVGASRRRNPRSESLRLMPFAMEYMLEDGFTETMIANGYNIGANGIGLFHAIELLPGTRCVCWLAHAAQGVVEVAGTARWCRPIENGVFLSGIEFDKIVNEYAHLPAR